MVTKSEMHMSFFDSARNAAWNAIKELGERLKCRMLNTQNDLRGEKKYTQDLETAIKRENGEFLVISLKHVRVLSRHANPAETQKLWAITHENDHKTRKRRVFRHNSQTCIVALWSMNVPMKDQKYGQ